MKLLNVILNNLPKQYGLMVIPLGAASCLANYTQKRNIILDWFTHLFYAFLSGKGNQNPQKEKSGSIKVYQRTWGKTIVFILSFQISFVSCCNLLFAVFDCYLDSPHAIVLLNCLTAGFPVRVEFTLFDQWLNGQKYLLLISFTF